MRYCHGVPNFNAPLSVDPNGSDLPLDDLVTLKYFYNLGIDYFRQNKFRMLPPPLPFSLEIVNPISETNFSVNDGNDDEDFDLESQFNMRLKSPTEANRNIDESGQQKISYSNVQIESLASKRKHSVKILEQKKLRSRSTGTYSCNVPSTDNNSSNESFNSVQMYLPSSTRNYPDSTNVEQLLTMQSACNVQTHSVHQYNTVVAPTGGLFLPSPDFVSHPIQPTISAENISNAHIPHNSNYSALVYSAPPSPQDYTGWGYPSSQPMYYNTYSGNGNATQ